jgi:hypothetical protein
MNAFFDLLPPKIILRRVNMVKKDGALARCHVNHTFKSYFLLLDISEAQP